MDTIFAISTAPGKAGVAVLRLSGPVAHDVTARYSGPLPRSRELRLRRLRLPDGSLLDEALVVVFDEGDSFTGEASAEWHLHGSLAVQRQALAALAAEPGCRIAEPGEFTRRALFNDRLDLGQVEGLSDLIEAETEEQRRRALRSLGGGLSEKAETWRADLLRAAALVEATIDFADEEIPDDLLGEVDRIIARNIARFTAELDGSKAAERIREGFEVAIVGAPNVGKSTLLNRLAGREAAITSEVAGTTRDVIEVRMEIGGLPVTLLDTAGLRESVDPVEREGVSRARARAAAADLRVALVLPGTTYDGELGEGDIVLAAKADHATSIAEGVSGKTGAGVDALIDHLAETLAQRARGAGLLDRERHRAAVAAARKALEAAAFRVESGAAEAELVAEDLRVAIRCLESLVGRIGVEDVLGEIFARFCIGK